MGRGFESHVGGYKWDLESYKKQMYNGGPALMPFNDRDWGRYFENGTYHHFADPRHATIAITEEAKEKMNNHDGDKPLFLYVRQGLFN